MDCDLFLSWTSCDSGGVQSCNPTLDTINPCVNYREGECNSQLCLPWIPRNPSLWIVMPLISLCILAIRGSPHEHILLLLFLIYHSKHALCWFTCYFVIHPHSHNSKIVNIYFTQIWVFQTLPIHCWMKSPFTIDLIRPGSTEDDHFCIKYHALTCINTTNHVKIDFICTKANDIISQKFKQM